MDKEEIIKSIDPDVRTCKRCHRKRYLSEMKARDDGQPVCSEFKECLKMSVAWINRLMNIKPK